MHKKIIMGKLPFKIVAGAEDFYQKIDVNESPK
jgi:hypothetical protein